MASSRRVGRHGPACCGSIEQMFLFQSRRQLGIVSRRRPKLRPGVRHKTAGPSVSGAMNAYRGLGFAALRTAFLVALAWLLIFVLFPIVIAAQAATN